MWFHITHARTHATHERTRAFNGPLSGTTRVSRYKKYKTNLDFTEARDSEWQWNPLGHMQVCTALLTDNHTSTQPLSFLQTGCPSCRPSNTRTDVLKQVTLLASAHYYTQPTVRNSWQVATPGEQQGISDSCFSAAVCSTDRALLKILWAGVHMTHMLNFVEHYK